MNNVTSRRVQNLFGRTNRLLALGFCCLAIIFFACGKRDWVNSPNNEDVKKVTEIANKWLDKKVFAAGTQKHERVEQLRQNLDLSNAYIESAGLNETIAVIPIKSGFRSFYQKGKKSTAYLFLSWTPDGTIQHGEIGLYIPDAGQPETLPRNVNAQINTGGIVNLKGSLAILTIYDRFLYSAKYKDGRRESLTLPKKKSELANAEAAQVSVNGVRPDATICTDWYLITTYYYTDGSSEVVDVTYWGRTCRETSCLPDEWCTPEPDGGGDGGGGGYLECNMEEEDADGMLSGASVDIVADGDFWNGPKTVDAGVIKRPVIVQEHRLVCSILGSDPPKYKLMFPGVCYKNSPTDTWKWESLSYSGLVMYSGVVPPCISVEPTVTMSGPILSASKAYGEWTATSYATYTVTCKVGAKTVTKLTTYRAKYYANDYVYLPDDVD